MFILRHRFHSSTPLYQLKRPLSYVWHCCGAREHLIVQNYLSLLPGLASGWRRVTKLLKFFSFMIACTSLPCLFSRFWAFNVSTNLAAAYVLHFTLFERFSFSVFVRHVSYNLHRRIRDLFLFYDIWIYLFSVVFQRFSFLVCCTSTIFSFLALFIFWLLILAENCWVSSCQCLAFFFSFTHRS